MELSDLNSLQYNETKPFPPFYLLLFSVYLQFRFQIIFLLLIFGLFSEGFRLWIMILRIWEENRDPMGGRNYLTGMYSKPNAAFYIKWWLSIERKKDIFGFINPPRGPPSFSLFTFFSLFKTFSFVFRLIWVNKWK